ncbi:MAG: type II secretion system protein M [Gammaproteobacteria bacterium]|nr:type II secretion system protein M [Gammaproteobacteria bacterium]
MNLKDWYLSKSIRDQRILNVIAVLIVLLLVYALLINPFRQSFQEKRSRVASQEKTLVWMQSAAATVQTLGGSQSTSVSRKSNKAPYILVDEVIRRQRLPAPARIEPAGSNGVRLQYQSVEFDRLLPLLDELKEKYQLSVSTTNFSRKEPGVVSARITLEATP